MLSLVQIFGSITFVIIFFLIVFYGGYWLYISNYTSKQVIENKINFNAKITLVLPTYNEESTIKMKLENLYKQTYPINFIEIIVIDSNSKDDTVKIANNFMNYHKDLNMKIIIETERKGKSEAINKAFSYASPNSEIYFMSDIDSILKKDAIEKIVSFFADQKIGAVFGRQVLLNPNESRETMLEKTYKYFFIKLRIGESVIDSTPIFDGELAAYRATVIRGIKVREDLNADDSQLAIIVRKKGYRAICNPEAIFYEFAPSNWSSKFIQKIRRSQGLSRMFWYNKDMLFKKKYGRFGFIIMPANFFMHVISPFLVFLSIIFSPTFLLSVLYQYRAQPNYWELWIILSISTVLFLWDFFYGRKFLNITWTFLEYQIIILMGILFFLFGISLHKWKKIESIRKKFLNEINIL